MRNFIRNLPAVKIISTILMVLLAGPVFADTKPTLSSGDTAWMLTSTALVLLMTIPGLSLFYAGMVRSKNALSVMMQCFAITCLMTAIWVFWAYSLAFSDGGGAQQWIGGLGKAFMKGVGYDTLSGTIPETVFSMFQLTFAIITPALIVGAFAERMKFSAMLWFMGLWVTLVYAPIAHWVWGGGWLGRLGAKDFAGGTVVHINAGMAGLVAALVLGKRKGYPETAMPPHSMVLTLVGAAMLWVGWFGFNAGSELAADGTAGMAMAVTQIATALRGPGVDVLRVDGARQAQRPGHRLGGGGRPGGDHPGLGLCRSHGRRGDRYRRGGDLLPRIDQAQACPGL